MRASHRDLAPSTRDVLLRGDSATGFELVEAGSLHRIQGQIPSIEAAVEIARAHGAGVIWQQSVDNRGRPLGDPVRLFAFAARVPARCGPRWPRK
jgi:hypothetical protein